MIQNQAPSTDDVLTSTPENGGCPASGMMNERTSEEKLRGEGLHERKVYSDQHMSVCKAVVEYT